ncbi:MAG: HAD-IIA family hydrolase [Elusimicrobiota bacterium]|jgi:NagD protein|nr:HAD-IIA family hydrolase [Elusimicrobiota bacterium]
MEIKYTDFMELSDKSALKARLKEIKHIAMDMDGTLYLGANIFPYTIASLQSFKDKGILYSFLTNNPTKNAGDYLEHLKSMGIFALREEIYTTVQASISHLKSKLPQAKKLFLLGTESMIKEFEEAGFISAQDSPDDKPDALVVSFDKSLVYSRLCRAAWWAKLGLPYIATNPDRVCPTDLPTVLVDCGSICAAIEYAVGRKPDKTIGKPDPSMLDGILQKYNLAPKEIAMIGDRLYTDMKMGKDAGALSVLVLTGETKIEDVKKSSFKPDIVVDKISDFAELLNLPQ